jgi:hypothetical protein
MKGCRLQRTVSPSQRAAVQIDIPHTGALICASDMPAASPPKSTRHTGKDLPPLRRDSCVRKLTGWEIDDLASVAACGCVFHTPEWWIDRDCASLVIMVEVGCMDEWVVKATRVRASARRGAYCNFHIIDNHQHDQSACLGGMWPLGQSRLLPAHLQTTAACASPRPVVPLT